MAKDKEAHSDKQTVRVILGKREAGFNGLWAAKRLWPIGETTAELTEDEIANVASRQELVVLDASGSRLVSDGATNPVLSESLTQDEAAALADYRRERAKNPALGETFAKKYRTEKKGEKGSEHPWGPATTNDAILRGAPPPVAEGMETKPLEPAKHVQPTHLGKDSKK